MEQRKLGKTGLSITTLGYGAMELRHVDEPAAARLLNALLDGGVNYIDTSPDYGPSEDYIGNTIAHRRSEYILATKCGCHVDQTGTWIGPRHIWTREKLQENIETSLRRLKTDHIDVWQLHGVFPEDLAGGAGDPVIETMLELKRQGKVRAIGMSYNNGGLGDPLHPAGYGFKYAPTYLTWNVFDMMQVVYGGLTRQNEDLIAEAAQRGLGMVARGVVKRYKPNYDELFEQAKLKELCAQDEGPDDFLVRFAQSHPGLATMIIGTKNPDHLATNIRAANRGPLPADVYAQAKQRLDAVGISVGKA